MQVVDNERNNPFDFEFRGKKVRDNFGTQYIKHCGHDTDYSFCPFTFKLYMQVVNDERRNPVDFWSHG